MASAKVEGEFSCRRFFPSFQGFWLKKTNKNDKNESLWFLFFIGLRIKKKHVDQDSLMFQSISISAAVMWQASIVRVSNMVQKPQYRAIDLIPFNCYWLQSTAQSLPRTQSRSLCLRFQWSERSWGQGLFIYLLVLCEIRIFQSCWIPHRQTLRIVYSQCSVHLA